MSDIAIRVEGLGKRYRIGLEEQTHETLSGAFLSWIKAPVKNYRRLKKLSSFSEDEDDGDVIWALRDVTFEVERGERLGLIGRNGAGKSTLLKVLSRITRPTCGYAEIDGRVSSLLEVGTGFHPELTGRENVYLNGTVLGMSKAEVDRKFDEIVAFSEIERFIDTPVKRYSSGMRVRLAFAVAAHLEPEILLVDEVLAVGDIAFQKKCIGKMDDVAKTGRTVLFVSHNMAMIQALCTHCLLMEDGKIVSNAPVDQAVNEYVRRAEQRAESSDLSARDDREGGEIFRFQSVDFLDPDTMGELQTLLSGQPVLVRLRYENYSDELLENMTVIITFFNASGVFMTSCTNLFVAEEVQAEPGPGEMYCKIPKWPFTEGRYYVELFANNRKYKRLDFIKDAGYVDVELGNYYGHGTVRPVTPWQGMFVEFEWLSPDDVQRPAVVQGYGADAE